jgi:eukaryotic-like serine/threonine-protein kinase
MFGKQLMNPERWQQIERLYHAAREHGPRVLEGTDPALRQEVERLLSEDSGSKILDGAAADLLTETMTAPILSGTRLGPYRIDAPIGAGGMGQVFRATDTRLGRSVAIKTSKSQFSERFEREARAISSLNHPNICQLYDVGPNYLVMEMIEGESPKGPLPVAQAERIALQIAGALDAAHEKGITHRDLKPANIKITPDGTVKVLDFGLAKVVGLTDGGETESGVIMGTVGYMAPEQARGQKVDKRADIWAFGVVIWELLTGERLFQGQSSADVLGKVLEQEIDVNRVPEKFRMLLARCLDRDVKTRLRDIGDVRLLLEEQLALTKLSEPANWWIAATAVFALATFALAYALSTRSSAVPPIAGRFSLVPSNKLGIAGPGGLPAISPDGRRIAVVFRSGRQNALWVRELDGADFRMLPGTEGANYPFWSPDGRSVAFFASGKLQRIDTAGGPPRTICEELDLSTGAWSQADVIVYGTRQKAGLFRVSAQGGTPVALSAPDPALGERSYRTPWFLPDGKHFLYTAYNSDVTKSRIYVESIDTKPGSHTRREVLAADSNTVYAPAVASPGSASDTGYLLFAQEGKLMAQPFDPGKAQITGGTVPVADQLDVFPSFSQGQFSVSQNGTLVYTSGAQGGVEWTQLSWIDRSGRLTGTVGTPAMAFGVRLSPDGSTGAVEQLDNAGTEDIWLHDLPRNTLSRFTFGPGFNLAPVWSPDSSRIVYYSSTSTEVSYIKAGSGAGKEELLDYFPGAWHFISDWSHDGRYLVATVFDAKISPDIWLIPQFGGQKPFAYINSPYQESGARVSPDGRWIAYLSDETKRSEVYVQTFPEHGGKWQISTNGGDWPVWSKDGRELYFVGADHRLMAVEVRSAGNNLQAGVPKLLFEFPTLKQFDLGASVPYDVSKDGRFLVSVPVDRNAPVVPVTLVTNWQSLLKKP